ncbi:MAG: SGNH/GDSL hydrolase family protein [Streptomycetaceae bacterium]|nr:SGNH/GDSL hydrolase family protein [Streptomycetaceae bacterium]
MAAPGAAAAPLRAHSCAPGGWVGSWETASAPGAPAPWGVASDYTLRQVVHLSVGGTAVRVRLSNQFGTSALLLGHVTVAVQSPGAPTAAAEPGTLRDVTFGGSPSAVVAPGGDLVGDVVWLPVRPGTNLMISSYLPGMAGPVTTHPEALQTSYFSTGGDHAGDGSGAAFTGTTVQWHDLTGVDVLDRSAQGSVVALGDSITDGNQSAVDMNHRWPDVLAARLLALPPAEQTGVLNAGISGNRLLLNGGTMGDKALDRLDEDVFSRTGVCTVVVLEGINDIQQLPHQHDPAKIEAAYRQIVDEAHARGIRVVGATLLPFKGFRVWSPALERTREAVNTYIRTSTTFDAVVDFDAVVRDPADPLRLRPVYDSGDHIHPDDAGYRAMGDAIDLRLVFPTSDRSKAS